MYSERDSLTFRLKTVWHAIKICCKKASWRCSIIAFQRPFNWQMKRTPGKNYKDFFKEALTYLRIFHRQ